MGQEMIQRILIREFGNAQARNPSFSQRAFAKRLGLSSGATSNLLNGKRKISKKMAQQLVERLSLDPVEKEDLLESLSKKEKKGPKNLIKPVKRSKTEKKLSLDQFEIVANPLHFTLLSLLELKSLEPTLENLAKKLERPPKEVQIALDRLERLDLIKRVGKKIIVTDEELASPDEVVSSAIKKHHVLSMEEAKESLLRDPLGKRDFTSQTLAISPDKLDEAKALIRTFGEQLAELLDEGEKEEVYKINVQFFPITH
ncbi:MAG: TIGR02147 family protein [Halobacteriovoraceae bacterium]|nr:TIGR02147 family protein [Halobacteriovoraceae bacterium]